MRTNIMKTVGFALFIGLLMPVGMLFSKESAPATGLTSDTARWYDVDEASNLLNSMQDLAVKARMAAAPIRTDEIDLAWQGQASMLNRARSNVNRMGDDLLRLDEISSRLEPWQQSLVHKITPHVHEMVYQLDAAIHTLNKYHMADRLALTQYPRNIAAFCKNSGRLVDTVGTVTQYVHAEKKMAELNKTSSPEAGS